MQIEINAQSFERFVSCMERIADAITPNEGLMDANTLAAKLGLSRQIVDRLRRNGDLPAYKVGGSYRYKFSECVQRVESIESQSDDEIMVERLRGYKQKK